ncbi:MAG: tetratricopeptide repeat protein [Deltaproteobacteria bacterium]|nr:tetratricopeptide repeat protein [Deltaproteobacteria bacterium]
MKDRRHILIAASLVAALTFLVYLPSLSNGFVNWDDPGYVYKNPNIRSLDLKWAFTAVVVGNWHPATLLSLALDHSIWGLNPLGFHLTNSIIHSLNAFLAALLGWTLYPYKENDRMGAVITGLMAGALFGLHPAHVESVAWVSERKDVLSAFFFILSALFYIRYARGKGVACYGLSLAAFTLALLSKPMAVSLPIVLLIIDFYPLDRFKAGFFKKTVIEKIPFFLLAGASAALALWAQRVSGALSSLDSVPLLERIPVAFSAHAFYIYKLCVPIDLSPFYPLPERSGIFEPWAIISVMSFAVISIAALVTLKRKKAVIATWAYYVITLLPVIGLVQVGSQAAADRYTYIPSLSLFILIGGATGYFASRNKKALSAVIIAVLLITSALSWLSIRQIGVWKDSVTLWSRAIALYPDSSPIAYTNRGIAFGQAGRVEEAIGDLSRAIEIKPNMAEAYYNRALGYSFQGRYTDAIKDLIEAIRQNPNYVDAYHNRAVAYANLADYASAIGDFKKVTELRPSYGPAYLSLAEVYLRTGERELADESFRRASYLGVKEADRYLMEGAQ